MKKSNVLTSRFVPSVIIGNLKAFFFSLSGNQLTRCLCFVFVLFCFVCFKVVFEREWETEVLGYKGSGLQTLM